MKVLIISEFFPPLNNIASGRPYSWASYLAKKNEVEVVTIEKDEKEALDYKVDTSNFNIKTIKRTFKRFSFINKFSWILKAFFKVKRNKYDIIISTSNPWQVHLLAYLLKLNNSNRKWIADYRDLWSGNFHTKSSRGVRNFIHTTLEKNIIRRSDLLTTVSQPLSDDLKKMFPSKKVEVLFNGFDTKINKPKEIIREKLLNKLTIVYSGTIYEGKRDPTSLFIAINELVKEGKLNEKEIEVKFFGKRNANLKEIIKRTNSSNFVKICGFVSREVSVEEQKKASLLLLLESGQIETKGVLTGKLFEYFASGTPVLSVGPLKDFSSSQLILKTKTGFVCENDTDYIKNILLKVKNSNLVFKPVKEEIEKYSRKEQAKKLEQLVYDISQ